MWSNQILTQLLHDSVVRSSELSFDMDHGRIGDETRNRFGEPSPARLRYNDHCTLVSLQPVTISVNKFDGCLFFPPEQPSKTGSNRQQKIAVPAGMRIVDSVDGVQRQLFLPAKEIVANHVWVAL